MRTLPQSLNGHNHLVLPAMTAAPALPESPCSVNVFFKVEGYERAQATGRGMTAEEAATNLRETILATKKALEAPPVVSMEARMGALLTCGMQKAVAKQDWCLVEKLSKAAALVLSGSVSPGEREEMLAVQSLSTPAHWYEVDGTVCSCPDYKHRHQDGDKAYYCKHGLAAMMYRKIHG